MKYAFVEAKGTGALRGKALRDVVLRVRKILRPLIRIEVKIRTEQIAVPPLASPWHLPGVTRQTFIDAQDPLTWVEFDGIHICHGPIKQGELLFFGGAAGCICCDKIRVSASTCFDNRTQSGLTRRDMIWSNAAIAAHEILHVWGAEHHRLKPGSGLKISLMDPGLAVWNAHRNVVISNLIKRQVRACLKKCGKN